ncbi:ATP-dependent DNA helicase RecQ [Maribacter sedimenticola]|uniref:ATP-dependent DNA helicase RecQ n=1 Tax=Maribacter sedimenticola TaxID=228956 RepID=A0ABY1SH86_9FLAO|nr:RecQ family ATP-dependent DNA helicase [Maribacter sedimenticola]SNR48725.1 ATP-dependent DNA helicase RecQ [Maribacter sedimenticola]
MNTTPEDILNKYWGFENFKGSQKSIINAVLNGKDVLGLLPTGGGKSICFQVPALMKDGICIVVSPLIALIENQVDNLQKLGIKALGLKGGLKFEDVDKLLDNCIYGNYKFLYLSPERLQQELVQERIKSMNVSIIVIDEAHCISEWGHDFRPAYLNCAILRDFHPQAPVLALTATATKRVTEDMVNSLELKSPLVVKDSFFRKNIGFGIIATEDKNGYLKRYCKQLKTSAIVYVRSRKKAEELSSFLQQNAIKATFYHGGMDQKLKTERLGTWLTNKAQVMVATNAFGMGIDKPDVALVIHYQIPDSIENYFQEAGRAGRNGDRAKAILLTNTTDKNLVKKQFLDVLPDTSYVKLVYKKLNNYFQIGFGEYVEEKFPLNFNEFCSTYKLNTYLTYNTLQLLDRNSVISLSENFSKKTTVKFKTDKSAIYRYFHQNPQLEEFVKIVLRTYGGLFEFDTQINTYLLAKKSNRPESVVQLNLEKLVKDDMIIYHSSPTDLEITFLVPRDDDRTINRFSKTMVEQNQVKTEKITTILDYIDNVDTCRSIQLLDYFGEKQRIACGICDVCERNKIGHTDIQKLKEAILEILQEQSASSRTLQEKLGAEQENLITALQELLEEKQLSLNAINEYERR